MWKWKAFATVQIRIFLLKHSKNLGHSGKNKFSLYSCYCEGGCVNWCQLTLYGCSRDPSTSMAQYGKKTMLPGR